MQGKSHLVCGLITGAACGFLMEFSVTELIATTAVSGLASVIPDIDLPESIAGKPVKLISKTINKMFGHRTITHSGLWLIPLFVLAVTYRDTQYFCLLWGWLTGFFSHLISDTMTKGGVPWLWPFIRKRLSLSRIKSGRADGFLCILSIGFIVFINYLMIQNLFVA